MSVIFHGRYNQNDLRNYPLVDSASRTAGDQELPMDFLADAAVRYPDTYEGTPYVASATLSPTLVACVISLRTPAGDVPLGWVSLTEPAKQMYTLTKLTPLAPGVSGWLVFGAAVRKKTPFRMCFDDAQGSALLPRVARSYHTPPVTSIHRADRSARLSGHVTMAGANHMEVIQADQDWSQQPDYNVYPRAMRVINGEKRPGIVLRLSNDLSPSELAAFLGVCYDNVSTDCSPPIIKTLNRVKPDENGNIDVIVKGIPTHELVSTDGVPEGIVIEMPVGLTDVCTLGKGLDPIYKPEVECD